MSSTLALVDWEENDIILKTQKLGLLKLLKIETNNGYPKTL